MGIPQGRTYFRSLMTAQGLVSSPGEFHPEALVEPDVNVSAHPAPIIQPKNGFVSLMGSSPCRLAQS